MKRVLLTVFFLFLFLLSTQSAQAQRYAVCDLCGYCPPNAAPSTWSNCRSCLYPQASGNPDDKTTLIIDQNANIPPTPWPGHYYSMIGCITTNLSDFTQKGAAANVVQTLLTIVFSFAGGIAFLYLLYGSFILLTSQSDPERINYGKSIIFGAIVGLIFCLTSVFIITIIASGVLKIPGFSQ